MDEDESQRQIAGITQVPQCLTNEAESLTPKSFPQKIKVLICAHEHEHLMPESSPPKSKGVLLHADRCTHRPGEFYLHTDMHTHIIFFQR